MQTIPNGCLPFGGLFAALQGDAMRRALLAWFAVAAFSLCAGPAFAQDMTFDLEDADAEPEEGEVEGEGEGEVGAEGGVEGDFGGDIIGDLAGGDDDTGGPGAMAPREGPPRDTETIEEIYAVQQIYALRINRVELSASYAATLNDPYVSHPAASIGLNYWWTNVLAIGLNFLWYQELEAESDLNFFVRRSTRLAVPITEYQLGAHLNFTYVPLYGKFMMFNEYIFQWDAYVVGGVGVMRTRPVPVIDPEIRQFEFDWRVAFNVGIGLRVFVTRFLSVYGELRDYAYLERLENLDVALGPDRQDPSTWLDDSPSLTNNVTAHVGLTLFFPFTFEYRLPK